MLSIGLEQRPGFSHLNTSSNLLNCFIIHHRLPDLYSTSIEKASVIIRCQGSLKASFLHHCHLQEVVSPYVHRYIASVGDLKSASTLQILITCFAIGKKPLGAALAQQPDALCES